MATFMGYLPEEEQALTLGRFIGDLMTKQKEKLDNLEKKVESGEKFVETCNELSKSDQHSDLLSKIIDNLWIVLYVGSPKEIEGAFYIVSSLLQKLGNETSKKLLPKITSILIQDEKEATNVKLRIKILNDIYNSFEDPKIRFDLFIEILKFVTKTNYSYLIHSHINSVVEKSSKWDLSNEQKFQLFKCIRDAFRDCDDKEEEFKWRLKYLSSFLDPKSNEAKNEAIAFALDTIKSPYIYQFDTLLEVEAMKSLQTTTPQMLDLLKIFVAEDVESFKSFADKNQDFLKSHDLQPDICIGKMRLLSLATLGAKNPIISYSEIAKALQIDENETEAWVVKAIGENILEAKMDQVKRVVIISRCLNRVFTLTQWKQLSDNLNHWKKNVQQIKKTLQQCVQQHQESIQNSN